MERKGRIARWIMDLQEFEFTVKHRSETLVLGHRLYEVGWPVPFITTFISSVLPPGPHALLGGQ